MHDDDDDARDPHRGLAHDLRVLALPYDRCGEVYASDGYAASATNLPKTSLASDGVFRDGSSLQVAAVTGSVAAGYVAALQLGVAV